MASIPPAIFFINGDITYPAEPPPNPPDLDVFIGSEPNNPTSYIASPSELTTLQIQLFIDDTMTKQEFDARVVADPNYPAIVHLRGLRILVILPAFYDHVNRELADVVLFLHQGMADVESNRFWHPDHDRHEEHEEISHTYPRQPPIPFPNERHHKVAYGPPGQSYDLQRLNVHALLRAAHSCNEICLPWDAGPRCGECNYPFYCDGCHTFSGIKICGNCKCDCKCGCYIVDQQGIKESPIFLPNCENEYHNRDFIHRK